MTEDIEEVIKEMGGRINYGEMPDMLASDFKYLKERAEGTLNSVMINIPEIKEISFDFINDYSFNAFAMGINQRYFIGMNRGTIATISLIYDRFFADKDIFRLIGNPELEDHNLPKIPNITLNYGEIVEGVPLFPRPKDTTRRAFVQMFVLLTFDFILAHEITHIVNGHVDLFGEELGVILDELKIQDSISANFSLIRKTMEMDADCGASATLLSSEIGKVIGKFPIHPQWTELYSMPGMVLLHFSFVISTLFRTFGDQRLDNNAFESDTYPQPRLRFVISMLRIAHLPAFIELNQKMNFDLDENDVPITVAAGFKIVEEAFSKIMGFESSTVSVEDAWGEIGFNQIDKLRKFWNDELMGKLQKYSYVELEAYPEIK